MSEFEKETKYKSAGKWAWFAERDARMRSAVNSSLFSDSQKLRAERVKLALELVYNSDFIKIEFRKKFISVKVQKPRVKDRKTLDLLEQDYKHEGYTKVLTAQGFTYRIS